jgi:hypothetical protein
VFEIGTFFLMNRNIAILQYYIEAEI